jgi:hypothetical protein
MGEGNEIEVDELTFVLDISFVLDICFGHHLFWTSCVFYDKSRQFDINDIF